jgi:hypothetical protein
MSVEHAGLTETQRRALGGRLARIEKLIARARALGFESDRLEELEGAVRDVRTQTAAITPSLVGNELQAALAEVVVTSLEIGPRQMRAYGTLSPEAAARLEESSRRLYRLSERLLEDYERRRQADAL